MPAPTSGPARGARHRSRPRSAGRRAALVAAPVAASLAVAAVLLALPPSGAPAGGAAPAPTTAAVDPSGSTAPPGATAGAVPGSSGDPATAAGRWLAEQPLQSGGVAVDPSLYDQVAGSSQLASRVVPAPLSGAVAEEVPARWLVAGPELRAAAVPGSWAAQALAGSRTVVVFGDGEDRVEVREVQDAAAGASPGASGPPAVPAPSTTAPSPTVTSGSPRATATAASEASLEELLANPRLDFSPRAREALRSERVDLRLAALLAQLAVQQPLSVADLPAAATSAGAEPVRTAVLDGVAGQQVGADPEALTVLLRQLSAQDAAYRAVATQQQDGTTEVLRLVLPPAGT